jgi:hemerythrin
MKKCDYSDFASHKEKHNKIVAQVEGFKERFNRGEDLGEEFSEFLEGWLLNHIKKSDKSYSKCLNDNGIV